MNDEFIQLVTKMRDYQRQYFEAKSKQMHHTAHIVLQHAKAYEKKVDHKLKELAGEVPASQVKMF